MIINPKFDYTRFHFPIKFYIHRCF